MSVTTIDAGADARVRWRPFKQNPRMPADAGLPSLGLVMQLSSSVMFCVNLAMLLLVMMPLMRGGRGLILLVALLGIVRCVVHFAAGGKFIDGSVDGLVRAKTYIIVSAVQTVLVIGLLATVGGGAPSLGGVAFLLLIFMAWPLAVLWVISRSEVRELYQRAAAGQVDLIARNRSIEGASALMTAMGIVGVIVALLLTWGFIEAGVVGGGFSGILLLLIGLSLILRSAYHTAAGVGGLRGSPPMEFHQKVKRYLSTAVASIVMVAVFGFVALATSGSPQIILAFVVLCGFLGAWPLVINGHAQRVGMTAFYIDEDSSDGFGPARDSGLTAIGFLLLGSAALSLASSVGGLFGASSNPFSALGMGNMDAQWNPGNEWYIALPIAAITLWAAIELIQMSERYKIAATVYAVTAGGSALISIVPMIGDLDLGRGNPLQLMGIMIVVAVFVIAFVLPILTVVLAYRYRPDPAALKEIFA